MLGFIAYLVGGWVFSGVYAGLFASLDMANPWLGSLFGLVHGMGFAGILQNMDLERSGLVISLFTFNLGVEIGQVAVGGLCWPRLTQLGKSPYRATVVKGLSLVIVLFGLLWFVQRVNV